MSLNQLRKFSHSIARRTRQLFLGFPASSEFHSLCNRRISVIRVTSAVPPVRPLSIGNHVDFRTFPRKCRGEPTQLEPNSRNPAGGLGSSLAPPIRSHVAIPSCRETNRFLCFLRDGPPRLGPSLSSPSYPSLFIVYFCALCYSLDCPRNLRPPSPPWPL